MRSQPALRTGGPKGLEDPARGGLGRGGLGSPVPPRRDDMPDVTAATRQTVAEQGLSLTLRSMSEHPSEALVQEYGWSARVQQGPPVRPV